MNSEDMADGIRGRLKPATTQTVHESEAVPIPPRIADYTMLRRIGGGSYGDVWLARSATGQLRAVKVVWRKNFSSERPYDREFSGIVQFEPISRSHPGVVNVLHVGRDDAAGCFFYVMELADAASEQVGKWESERVGTDSGVAFSPVHSLTCSPANYSPHTLASDLESRGRLPVSDVLRLGVQLADALGHLHRHGLVHRDVKPSNVIFVRGHVKLADIGLVTAVQEARSFVGTEGFIPPEGPGTEKADLFALGRLLYEAATGKDRCEFPQLPGDLENWPASEREALLELNEVLAKLCAPDLADRHANAAEVAGDLNLILAGRSVRRAYGIERRLRRATQISVAALAVVLLATGVVWFQRSQQHDAETRAAHERTLRQRAEAAEREARGHLYTALLEQARARMVSGEMGHRVNALDAIRRAAAISNSAELRREVMVALALPDLRFKRELPFGADVNCVFLDPSFERLAVCRGREPVEIHAVSDNRLLATLPVSTNLPAFRKDWSADGRFLAVKREYPDDDPHADWEVWDVVREKRVLLLRNVSGDAFSFHPWRPRLIAGSPTEVAIWNLEEGRKLDRFPLAGSPVLLSFSPDGKRFAAFSTRQGPDGSNRLSVHDATNPDAPELASHVFQDDVTTMAWHPDGRSLVVPDHGGAVRWVDAQTGEMTLLGRHKFEAVRAVFSPDGAYLFTGGWERDLICWDTRTKRRAFTASLNSYRIQFSGDGRHCAVKTESSVQLYDFERPAAHREFAEQLGVRVRRATISPDGRWLAASGDKRAGVWDLSGSGAGAIDNSAYDANFCFTPEGRELFGNRNDGTSACFRWRLTPATNAAAPPVLTRLALRTSEGLTTLSLVSNSIVMTSSEGSQILAPGASEPDGERWVPTSPGINGVSPDGRWLGIRRHNESSLYVYTLPELNEVARLTNPISFADFRFSPRGDEVAIGSHHPENLLTFWNTTTWEQTGALTNVSRVLYASDARTLWLLEGWRKGGLYDARTLEPLLLLPMGRFPLALSPDGQRVAVSVDAQRLQLWDLTALRQQLRELGLDWSENRELTANPR